MERSRARKMVVSAEAVQDGRWRLVAPAATPVPSRRDDRTDDRPDTWLSEIPLADGLDRRVHRAGRDALDMDSGERKSGSGAVPAPIAVLSGPSRCRPRQEPHRLPHRLRETLLPAGGGSVRGSR